MELARIVAAFLVSFTASGRCNFNEGKTVKVRSCSFWILCLVLNYRQFEFVSSGSACIAEGGSSASLLRGKSSSTNKLTAWTRVLLEKVVVHLIGKIPGICGT